MGGEGGEAEPKQTRTDRDYKVHDTHPTKAGASSLPPRRLELRIQENHRAMMWEAVCVLK